MSLGDYHDRSRILDWYTYYSYRDTQLHINQHADIVEGPMEELSHDAEVCHT